MLNDNGPLTLRSSDGAETLAVTDSIQLRWWTGGTTVRFAFNTTLSSAAFPRQLLLIFPRDDCKLLNQLRYLRFIPGPTRGDSSLACISRTLSSEIWKLGTAVLQQQPSFLQKPVIQPQLGLLCTPQEGLLGAYEEETDKQSEVIPPRLFACSLSQIHVAIILQRQVVARAIPTQWEEAGTMNAIVTKNTREHETPEMFDRLIHDACC